MWGGRRSGDGDGVSNGNEGGRSQRRRRRNDTIRAEESGGGHSAAITIQSVGLRRSAEQIQAAANLRQLVRTSPVWPVWSWCHHN